MIKATVNRFPVHPDTLRESALLWGCTFSPLESMDQDRVLNDPNVRSSLDSQYPHIFESNRGNTVDRNSDHGNIHKNNKNNDNNCSNNWGKSNDVSILNENSQATTNINENKTAIVDHGMENSQSSGSGTYNAVIQYPSRRLAHEDMLYRCEKCASYMCKIFYHSKHSWKCFLCSTKNTITKQQLTFAGTLHDLMLSSSSSMSRMTSPSSASHTEPTSIKRKYIDTVSDCYRIKLFDDMAFRIKSIVYIIMIDVTISLQSFKICQKAVIELIAQLTKYSRVGVLLVGEYITLVEARTSIPLFRRVLLDNHKDHNHDEDDNHIQGHHSSEPYFSVHFSSSRKNLYQFINLISATDPRNWILNVENIQHKQNLIGAIEKIPLSLLQGSNTASKPKRCFGTALHSIINLLDSIEPHTLLPLRFCSQPYDPLFLHPALIFSFLGGPPTTGEGAILPGDEQRSYFVSDKQSHLSTPYRNIVRFYDNLGKMAKSKAISINFFIIAQVPCALDRWRHVATRSAGKVFFYENHQAWTGNLQDDLLNCSNQSFSLNGLLKIRTTPEFHVTQGYGEGLEKDLVVTDVFNICAQGLSSSFAFDFGYRKEDGFCGALNQPAIQCAFKYLHVEKNQPPQMYLRIFTGIFPIAQQYYVIQKHSIISVQVKLIFHHMVNLLFNSGRNKAHEYLNKWLEIISASTCASRSSISNVDRNSDSSSPYGISKSTSFSHSHSPSQSFFDFTEWRYIIYGLHQSFLFRNDFGIDQDQLVASYTLWQALSSQDLLLCIRPQVYGLDFRDGQASLQKSTMEATVQTIEASEFDAVVVDAYFVVAVWFRNTVKSDNQKFYEDKISKLKKQYQDSRGYSSRLILVKRGNNDRILDKLLIDETCVNNFFESALKRYEL